MALSFFVKYIAKDIKIAIYEICVLKYLLENFLGDRGFEKLKLASIILIICIKVLSLIFKFSLEGD